MGSFRKGRQIDSLVEYAVRGLSVEQKKGLKFFWVWRRGNFEVSYQLEFDNKKVDSTANEYS